MRDCKYKKAFGKALKINIYIFLMSEHEWLENSYIDV